MAHKTSFTVFKALPEKQQKFWDMDKYSKKQISEYVSYPDKYYGMSAAEQRRISKYLLFFKYPTDRKTSFGINNYSRMFHYLPVDTDIYEGCGAWQANSTDKWKFVHRGFKLYLTKIMKWLGDGDKENALIACCCFLHFLQDQTAYYHSLEGADGGSQWILDGLIKKPDGSVETPTSLINEQSPEISLADYEPILLGANVEETCFHLYARYREAKQRNRLCLIPIVQAHYESKIGEEREIRRQVSTRTAELTLDFIYTVYCLANRDFPKNKLKKLKKIHLDQVKPINYPRHLCVPYRMSAIVRNYALDDKRRKHPLQLLVKQGKSAKQRTFKNGFGLGCHREAIITYPVPQGVYRQFRCYLGLHSKLGKGGKVGIVVKYRNKVVLKTEIEEYQPGIKLEINVLEGGLLSFIFRSKTQWNNTGNNLVIAEPCFVK